MPRKRPRQPKYRYGSERLDEVAAVLEVSPEATDTEICDAINHWWHKLGHEELPLTHTDVTRIRTEMGIPQTSRKPFQKRLFDVEES